MDEVGLGGILLVPNDGNRSGCAGEMVGVGLNPLPRSRGGGITCPVAIPSLEGVE